MLALAMKRTKFVTSLVAVAIPLLSLGCRDPAKPEANPTLINGSFESGIEGWRLTASRPTLQSGMISGGGRNDSACLNLLVGPNQHYASASQVVGVPQNAKLTVEAWAKAKATDMIRFVAIEFRHQDSGGAAAHSEYVTNSFGWKKLTTELQVPGGATEAYIFLNAMGKTGAAQFDDVKISLSTRR